jgi:hypothetical protein
LTGALCEGLYEVELLAELAMLVTGAGPSTAGTVLPFADVARAGVI